MFDVGLNVRDETAFRILLGPQHRIFDGPGVGTAMGLDHRLLDPQEGCAAHLAGIQQLFHLPQIPFHQTGGQLGLGAGEEHLLQGLEQELAYALHGFQHHIAGEAVGNDHIGGAHHGLVGLHIADEVDASCLAGRPQQLIGLVAQRVALGLPLLPTTTIGSFPQTKEVRAERAKLRKGEITKAEYDEFMKDQIDACIKHQEEIGLDVLVHGEFERNDMVEYFGQNLNGFLFTKNAWVQSYGTRCVKPPIVWGDVSRANPITVEWSAYAQSRTDHVMKGMLTGPVTILNWSWPREDITHEQQTQQLALAIRDEVLDLEKAGIKVIQIDEAALREKLPLRKTDWHAKYLDWAIPAFRLVHSAVKPTTQIHTHMCYSEFNDIIKDIDAMDADVISFEASRGDLVVLDAIHDANFETEAGPGVYDIHSPRIPSEQEIEDRIYEILKKMDVEKVWINPDCGLKTRGNAETWPSLENLVAAAKAVRAKLAK